MGALTRAPGTGQICVSFSSTCCESTTMSEKSCAGRISLIEGPTSPAGVSVLKSGNMALAVRFWAPGLPARRADSCPSWASGLRSSVGQASLHSGTTWAAVTRSPVPCVVRRDHRVPLARLTCAARPHTLSSSLAQTPCWAISPSTANMARGAVQSLPTGSVSVLSQAERIESKARARRFVTPALMCRSWARAIANQTQRDDSSACQKPEALAPCQPQIGGFHGRPGPLRWRP